MTKTICTCLSLQSVFLYQLQPHSQREYTIVCQTDSFLLSCHLVCEDNDSLLYRLGLLAGLWWDSESENCSLKVSFELMQKNIPSQLVCGSRATYLDSMLPGVQVTAELGFFLYLSHLVYTEDSENSDSLLYRSWPS